MLNRANKRLCSKCGTRHIKPTWCKCPMSPPHQLPQQWLQMGRRQGWRSSLSPLQSLPQQLWASVHLEPQWRRPSPQLTLAVVQAWRAQNRQYAPHPPRPHTGPTPSTSGHKHRRVCLLGIWATYSNQAHLQGDWCAMLQHLCDLMHGATMYPWESVHNFHKIVLPDRARWGDMGWQSLDSRAMCLTRLDISTYCHPSWTLCIFTPLSKLQKGCGPMPTAISHHREAGWHMFVCGWCLHVRQEHSEKDCSTKKKRDSKQGGPD